MYALARLAGNVMPEWALAEVSVQFSRAGELARPGV
jgi:hypothetical protein